MALIQAVTCMLETYLHEESASLRSQPTYFHASRPPGISIRKYLSRLCDYLKCSQECFVLALIYIDRLICAHSDLNVDKFCIHRLVLTGTAIAAKFFDDKYYKNSYYAKVGGVSLPEMNRLESEFLVLVDFQLFVKPEQYEEYTTMLFNHFGDTEQ